MTRRPKHLIKLEMIDGKVYDWQPATKAVMGFLSGILTTGAIKTIAWKQAKRGKRYV